VIGAARPRKRHDPDLDGEAKDDLADAATVSFGDSANSPRASASRLAVSREKPW